MLKFLMTIAVLGVAAMAFAGCCDDGYHTHRVNYGSIGYYDDSRCDPPPRYCPPPPRYRGCPY